MGRGAEVFQGSLQSEEGVGERLRGQAGLRWGCVLIQVTNIGFYYKEHGNVKSPQAV